MLEGWVRAHLVERCMVQRARVVLLAADGLSNGAIAGGVRDRPRAGRPPVSGHDERLRGGGHHHRGDPAPEGQWTHRAIAERFADTGMSAEDTVGAFCPELDLKPHLVRAG